jgi:hypothetical protein
LYACDEKWWRHHWDNLEHYGGERWTQVHNDAAKKFAEELGLNAKPGASAAGLGRDKIHHGGNSGYQAINLAYLMGAAKIILLGYDMHNNGMAHFFGDHPKGLSNGRYDQYVSNFTRLAKDLAAAGIEVINCTPDSALTQFAKKDFQAILNCG